MNDGEKKKAITYLNQQWNDFVQKTNQKLN